MINRYILHSDLNNFYASVECLYNPKIRNSAVVVVGDAEKRHGIVLAKNYIAKSYGIKTGDTISQAQQKCDEKLECVTCDLEKYAYISKLIKNMYREYTNKVESFGIDEAWLDLTENNRVKSFADAEKLANEIRKRVIDEFGLTVSVGVSFNKIFAKLGSDLKKPNAVTVITNDNYKSIVWKQKVDNLLYVGEKTNEKLEKIGVKTIGDLATTNVLVLKSLLGKNGETLWKFANGLDDSPVKLKDEQEQIKSIGNSTTCPYDLQTNDQVKTVIYILAENVAKRLKEKKLWCSEVCFVCKTGDLESKEKMKKIEYPTNLASEIGKCAYSLFLDNFNWNKTIRAIGIRVCGLCERPMQYNMFYNEQTILKKEKLELIIDNLRERFGYKIISRASVGANKDFGDLNPYTEQHKIHPFSYFKPE